jgi:two-component system, NarL family, nitrate/nitrite response regulator NarL
MNPITVLIAEDHKIVREGLRALLKLQEDMEVVGEAENGPEAVAMAGKLHPDVVVMDISMPLLNGLEATRQILQTAQGAKVLMLSAHSEDAYVDLAMALGASGYLIKQTAADVLPDAIRRAHQGETFFSSSISKRREEHDKGIHARGGRPGKASAHLGPREMAALKITA